MNIYLAVCRHRNAVDAYNVQLKELRRADRQALVKSVIRHSVHR